MSTIFTKNHSNHCTTAGKTLGIIYKHAHTNSHMYITFQRDELNPSLGIETWCTWCSHLTEETDKTRDHIYANLNLNIYSNTV